MKRSLSLIILLLAIYVHANAQVVFNEYRGNAGHHTLTKFNGKLYFIGADPLKQNDIYTLDITTKIFRLFYDFYPGQTKSTLLPIFNLKNPSELYPHHSYSINEPHLLEYNNSLFFAGYDNSDNYELFNIDKTNTIRIIHKDYYIFTNPPTAHAISGTVYNSNLYFLGRDTFAQYGLWRTDGTDTGTHLVRKISDTFSINSDITVHNNLLFFIAADKDHGAELWVSDGTASGTAMLKDINPGKTINVDFRRESVNGLLYFTADDGVHGEELWVTDGTVSGTYMVKDICPGNCSDHVKGLYPYNNKLYFTAIDSTYTMGLWVSDGTASGTYRVKQLKGGSYTQLQEYNGLLYFNTADTGDCGDLWKTNGTIAGTQKVYELSNDSLTPANGLHRLFSYKNHLYIVNEIPPLSYELYISDGTTAGTKLIKPRNATKTPSKIQIYKLIDSSVYFAADYTGPMSLWSLTDTTSPPVSVPPPPPPPHATTTENINATALSIHPNPVTDMLIITGIKQEVEVSITTITGKNIKLPVKYYGDTFEINTSSLSPGVYFIRAGEGNAKFIKK